MKLFSATQMSWSEPLFFLVRLRERRGWTRRGLLLLVIFLVMFLAIHFTAQPAAGARLYTRREPGRGPRAGLRFWTSAISSAR